LKFPALPPGPRRRFRPAYGAGKPALTLSTCGNSPRPVASLLPVCGRREGYSRAVFPRSERWHDLTGLVCQQLLFSGMDFLVLNCTGRKATCRPSVDHLPASTGRVYALKTRRRQANAGTTLYDSSPGRLKLGSFYRILRPGQHAIAPYNTVRWRDHPDSHDLR
jgi:hypothetical protein